MFPHAAALSVLIVFAAASSPLQTAGYSSGVCTESPTVRDRPPDDPNASSFASPAGTWYPNDSRTLWAWWWGQMSDGGYKVLWVRPGQALNVTGTRLDGTSVALKPTYRADTTRPFSRAVCISRPRAAGRSMDAPADSRCASLCEFRSTHARSGTPAR